MIRLAIFVAVSAVFGLLTRRSLLAPCSHGFYRFFAFELLSGLVLLNAPDWFRDPFSVPQLASWVLLIASTGLAIEAFRLFFKIGRPARGVGYDTDLWFENTTALVTISIYRLIRHPMYASLIGLGWGAFLKHPGWLGFGLALGASGFLVITSVAEEREIGRDLAQLTRPTSRPRSGLSLTYSDLRSVIPAYLLASTILR